MSVVCRLSREQSEEEQELGGGGLLRQRRGLVPRPDWRHRGETTEAHLTRQTVGKEERKF